MSKEKRENIARGARENRYTKDYSNKLQEDKLGEKNLSAVLTWDLVNEIRKISREENISQYELANMFNVGRATIADIINYRTWTVNPKFNERVYKDDNIRIIKNVNINSVEFDYDDLKFNNVLLKFEDEYLYIEKLSIQGLIYIEQRSLEGKCLASADICIPKNKSKLMKKFYSIAKMNPRSKGRPYFYNFIDKAFNNINN
jgi:DNA-binding transcriptional regulator YiaG